MFISPKKAPYSAAFALTNTELLLWLVEECPARHDCSRPCGGSKERAIRIMTTQVWPGRPDQAANHDTTDHARIIFAPHFFSSVQIIASTATKVKRPGRNTGIQETGAEPAYPRAELRVDCFHEIYRSRGFCGTIHEKETRMDKLTVHAAAFCMSWICPLNGLIFLIASIDPSFLLYE